MYIMKNIYIYINNQSKGGVYQTREASAVIIGINQ